MVAPTQLQVNVLICILQGGTEEARLPQASCQASSPVAFLTQERTDRAGHSSRHAEPEPSRPNPYQGSAMKLNRAFCFFPNHSQAPSAAAIDNKFWCRWMSLKEKAAWRVHVESEEEQAQCFSPWEQRGGRLEICMSVGTVFSISCLNASPGPCRLPLWVTVWATPRTGPGLSGSSGRPDGCTHFMLAKTGTPLSRTRGNLHWCHDDLKTTKPNSQKYHFGTHLDYGVRSH